MDYAFVPGIGDEALEKLATILSRRTQTTVVILVDQTSTLDVFLSVLKSEISGGFQQCDDLLLGAHGSVGGFLGMALDGHTPAPVNYESVENITTVKIPAGVGTANTVVRMASCNLGNPVDLPFLRAFKRALGNPKNVTAPRYLHAFASPSTTQSWEYMVYRFVVLGSNLGVDPLTTRDALVGKFGDGNFKFFDGTDVPLENFEAWVPQDAKLNLNPATSKSVSFDFPVDAQLGGSLTAVLHATGFFLSKLETFPETIDGATVPVGAAAQRQLLETELGKRARFTSAHVYPVYIRYGLASLHEFVNGWKWTVTSQPGNKLRYIGTRHTYELRIPVTKPGTKDWIFNIYHATGSPTINLNETTQPLLYGIV